VVEYKTGSVFSEWHRDARSPLKDAFDHEVEMINRIPRRSTTIVELDIADLKRYCEEFEVEYSEEKLRDRSYFEKIVGKIKKKMIDMLLKELKPENPNVELLKEIWKAKQQSDTHASNE